MALIGNPKVLILDEPTSGLDPKARRNLLEFLKNMKETSLMISTHTIDEAEFLCDKVAVMTNGQFECIG